MMERWAIIAVLAMLMLTKGDTVRINRATLEKIRREYGGIIRKYSALYGVPEDLITSIIYVESRGNPYAESLIGASGLMQVWWPAALQVGEIRKKEDWHPRDFFDPDRNIRTGVQYLAYLRDWFYKKHGRFPTIKEWARMYNGGNFGYKKPTTEPYGRMVVAAMSNMKPEPA
ncbi:MAG: transglycosylase SLT domain-containing protein [Candidatus Hydrothermae bacterium]|nr:transglycosylase SLT domain-containing protein [Candidatus Hydrothermae bacterium]